MDVVRKCCYAFQECNGPTTCSLYPQGAFGVVNETLKWQVKHCPKAGRPLKRSDYHEMTRRRFPLPGRDRAVDA